MRSYGSSIQDCKCAPFQIDRYLGNISGPLINFIALDMSITNNTIVHVNTPVQSLTSSAGGTIQLTDVLNNAKDWENLNLADSKTYLALGISVKDAIGWNVRYDVSTRYAVKAASKLSGSLPANTIGSFIMTANFGLALDHVYTVMYSQILCLI